MSAPVTKAGNEEVRQQSQPRKDQRDEMGDGHVMGNITKDPEIRFTQSGKAVCNLRIAYVPRIKAEDGNGWRDGDAEYYDLHVWGKQGERVAECLEMGDRIVAAGTWFRRTWQDREGKDRTAIELTVRDIGPSLLFTEALVKRNKRGKGGNGA